MRTSFSAWVYRLQRLLSVDFPIVDCLSKASEERDDLEWIIAVGRTKNGERAHSSRC
jgi:hypothetical protein